MALGTYGRVSASVWIALIVSRRKKQKVFYFPDGKLLLHLTNLL